MPDAVDEGRKERVFIHRLGTGKAMTIASRLALAMIALVVVTSCVVSVFAWYFIAEASARGVLTAIISAALAGGARLLLAT